MLEAVSPEQRPRNSRRGGRSRVLEVASNLGEADRVDRCQVIRDQVERDLLTRDHATTKRPQVNKEVQHPVKELLQTKTYRVQRKAFTATPRTVTDFIGA